MKGGRFVTYAQLPIDTEPGALIRMSSAESLEYLAFRGPEGEAIARRNYRDAIPEGWTDSEERQYQDYLLNVQAVYGR